LTHIRLFIFISILIFLISCEKDNPTKPKEFPPVLSNLAIPDTFLTGIDQSYIFSVKCTDENGLDDIDAVSFKILRNSGQLVVSGNMFDDGNYNSHGDNVPGDGKYSVLLKLDLDTDKYHFAVQAVDHAKLMSDELSDTFYVMPGVINNAPVITKYHIPDMIYVDEIVPFYLSVEASDPDSLDYIEKVTYQILEPTLTEVVETNELNDQGVDGDSVAADGTYSIETTTAFANWTFGNFHLMIQAFDSHNTPSKIIHLILPWAKKNIGVAPQILSANAPDTIQLPSTGDKSFLLSASVTDSDNNKDIKAVVFNTFKPDGSPSTGNPFKMYDDGTSGDAVAGDYIFSLRIFITATNAVGNYRFEFQAIDYSDLLSEKIIHTITVTQ
jgi:hypothetical protein